MVLYKGTAVTSKNGINFIRSVVERAGSLFHKVEQESDLGIDALIELVNQETPLGKMLAAQIKSGQSYFNPEKNQCLIPVETHRQYWLDYALPVIGIVFVPSLGRAHWVDIKTHLRDHPETTVIRFGANETNRFDDESFRTLFLPRILKKAPELPLSKALALAQSKDEDELLLGIISLFRRHPNQKETWDRLVQLVKERAPDQVPPVVIYFLAHIPRHPDIAYSGELISHATREYAKGLMAGFGRAEIVKLLSFIDEENLISRGSLGQSVEAIVSSLPRIDEELQGVAMDAGLEMRIRERAALILAMHRGAEAIPFLDRLCASGSWYAGELLQHVQEFGRVNPY